MAFIAFALNAPPQPVRAIFDSAGVKTLLQAAEVTVDGDGESFGFFNIFRAFNSLTDEKIGCVFIGHLG
ncbi:MAG: hypothetical protein WBN03_01440, partial [Desulfobacterales bacterium]